MCFLANYCRNHYLTFEERIGAWFLKLFTVLAVHRQSNRQNTYKADKKLSSEVLVYLCVNVAEIESHLIPSLTEAKEIDFHNVIISKLSSQDLTLWPKGNFEYIIQFFA